MILVLVVLVGVAVAAAADFKALDAFAQQIASQSLYSGMIHVEQGGKELFSKGFGYAVPELGVPMRNDHRYPIGSNTKLFTAVAVWQLHKAGKLSVFAPVSDYLNNTQLGLPPGKPWCPRTKDAPADGPCQTPQLQELLRMAGGVLGFDNCDYSDDAWQQDYCLTGPRLGEGLRANLSNVLAMAAGQVGIAGYLKASGVLDMPLDFAPGSAYHYSNPGFALAGYVVEQVSGLPIATYYSQQIFSKAGLASSLYDATNGILGLHKGMLPFPAYVSYLTPANGPQFEATAGGSMEQLVGAVGSLQGYGFGDIRSSYASLQPSPGEDSGTPSSSSSSGQATQGLYAFTGHSVSSNIDWTLANAAGAIVSTPQDMAAWFRVLLTNPSRLGLDKATVRQMLGMTTVEPRMPTYNNNRTRWLYAQGVIVVPDPAHQGRGLGVSHLYYLGSLGGFLAAVYQSLHPTDPSQDVFVNVLASTVLPPTSTWPEGIQTQPDGNCKFNPAAGSGAKKTTAGGRGSSSSGAGLAGVPGVLCEVKDMVPSMLTTVHDLLARKAVEAVTGRLWFDLQY